MEARDHQGAGAGSGSGAGSGTARSHWVRWHEPYENPDSQLSVRLRLVQDCLREALDRALHASGSGPIRVVSFCAGQGRDVIDVLAGHERPADVRALLVEQDPALVAFARDRAAAAGLRDIVHVVEGDASLASMYVGAVPADVVLVCGVFGNIDDADVARTVAALPSFCAPGADVIWTRHHRPPDLTTAIRCWFAEAGFEEVCFHAPPPPYVLSVGHHRLADGAPQAPFDETARLFDFVGDGGLPA